MMLGSPSSSGYSFSLHHLFIFSNPPNLHMRQWPQSVCRKIFIWKKYSETGWCDLPGPGAIRSKLGTTSSWHEPSHVSSPERSSLLEKKGVFIHSCSPGRGITHRDAVSFLLWHHLHFYVFNLVLLFVDVPFPKTQPEMRNYQHPRTKSSDKISRQ